MILDSLHNASRYTDLHPHFRQAFDYLQQTDFSKLDDGTIELHGREIYVTIATNVGKNTAPLEAHRNYIDIQMPLSGEEQIGWKPTIDCKTISETYDAQRDIEFFADEFDNKITLKPGQFVIFFPEDAHAPAMANNVLRKLVLKIKINF